MCNHYEKNVEVIGYALDLFGNVVVPDDLPDLPSHTYPKYIAPVVLHDGTRKRLEFLRWGINVKVQGKTKPVTNARDDKLSGFTWRYSVNERRCLIGATAYFEPYGEPSSKGEVRFTLRDRPEFFFAGIWDTDADGVTRAFTMVTTGPNELASVYHDRMPLVLDDDGAREWLGYQPLAPERLAALCRPYRASEMASAELPRPVREQKITQRDLNPASDDPKFDFL